MDPLHGESQLSLGIVEGCSSNIVILLRSEEG